MNKEWQIIDFYMDYSKFVVIVVAAAAIAGSVVVVVPDSSTFQTCKYSERVVETIADETLESVAAVACVPGVDLDERSDCFRCFRRAVVDAVVADCWR